MPKTLVNEKIRLLRDFCIIRGMSDPRVPKIKSMLHECKSEYSMDMLLYNVLRDRETIDDLLARKGYAV